MMKSIFPILAIIFILVLFPMTVFGQLIADLLEEEKPEISVSLNDFRYDPDFERALTMNRILDEMSEQDRRSFMGTISETPGLAFLSSLILPGFGQAANRQWWKTAIFAGVEIGAIVLYHERRAHAQRTEREYWRMADNHWSVVQYAGWLREYSQLDIAWEDILTAEGLARYQQDGFVDPAFNTDIDWATIDLGALNDFEARTLFRTTGLPFSHVVPAYGSQQYYELTSKYFQFGPGWRDWTGGVTGIDQGISTMSPMWHEHNRIESEFNEAFRFADNMIVVILANHILSAFDAFFTSKLRLHRQQIETTASLHHTHANVNLKVRF